MFKLLTFSPNASRHAGALLALAGALFAVPSAQAVVDAPIFFTQAGQVDIILTGNAGGFDHILEPVMVSGNRLFNAGVPTPPNTPPNYYAPWLIGTDGTSNLTLVGDPGAPRAPTGFNYNWGYFDVLPGQEITFRLSNIETNRIGGFDPDRLGTIVSQIFSGSSSANNTLFAGGSVLGNTPGAPSTGLPTGYTNVVFTSATEINIFFEDLDPLRLPEQDRWQNMSVRLILTPVPEAGTQAMLLLGLVAVAAFSRARRRPAAAQPS
jgi:PEP-CTERM motif